MDNNTYGIGWRRALTYHQQQWLEMAPLYATIDSIKAMCKAQGIGATVFNPDRSVEGEVYPNGAMLRL